MTIRALYVGAALLLAPAFAHATTIIIVRANDVVYIGADSLLTVDDTTHETGCKIRRTLAGFYVAAAGVVAYPPTQFDLGTLIETAGRRDGTLADKAAAFEDIGSASILALAAGLRTNEPGSFSERYLNRDFLVVAFAGIEAGRATVALRAFKPVIDPGGALSLTTLSCPPLSCTGGNGLVLVVGEKSAIWPVPAATVALLRAGAIPRAIRELIATQISATPDIVGPPITILRISASGSEWIEGGELCTAAPPLAIR